MPDPPERDPAFTLPRTRSAMVAEELRKLIGSGELAPGQRLRQAEIAKRFGVSTTPVREAFSVLARAGLVQHDAHRGVVVFVPQIADLTENYEIRGVLEPLATRLAAKQLTDEQLAELDEILGLMRREQDHHRYEDLNRRFHAAIYAGANRPQLAAIIESLRDAAKAYLRLNATRAITAEYQEQVHREHEAIVAALRARDSRAAHKLMADHLRHNERQLKTLVDAGADDQ